MQCATKENKEMPNQVEMFCETRQSKKGEPLDQETTNARAQLKDLIENSSHQPHEAFQSVFGKEKPGRVRCHGRVTTPTLLKRTEKIAKFEKKHVDELKLLNDKVEKMEAKYKQEMSSMEQKFQILLTNVINQNNSGVDVEALATMLLTSGTSILTHVPNNDKVISYLFISSWLQHG
ncbi:hypothetical protein TanjilG_00207 [Lupinus angustifolius]|uniref:Uncharacterized protein n=1 Tax=Lupinus angustifolius TaxID=3871 RepID=A0A394D2H9_LUPAN|nr:hypothetical protein TanjilG_00207 [Lupinus angustifolius]